LSSVLRIGNGKVETLRNVTQTELRDSKRSSWERFIRNVFLEKKAFGMYLGKRKTWISKQRGRINKVFEVEKDEGIDFGAQFSSTSVN
jgi:hypothetical protein